MFACVCSVSIGVGVGVSADVFSVVFPVFCFLFDLFFCSRERVITDRCLFF